MHWLYCEILTEIRFLAEVFKMQILKKVKQKQTKSDSYYFETKVEVFYKHKKGKILQCFKKIYRFVGDALVTGTKF